MKKSLIAAVIVGSVAANVITPILFNTQPQPAIEAQNGKDIIQSDPYRPSFDIWGNEWSYDGKLIHAACPNVPDPISGKDNPECKKKLTKPATQPITNKSVQCGVGK